MDRKWDYFSPCSCILYTLPGYLSIKVLIVRPDPEYGDDVDALYSPLITRISFPGNTERKN
jgi:hypothetical protein